jgi:aspartyl-tRNA(Asn)/glutamyl-tRNA(Gln) amidotransferase subunit C
MKISAETVRHIAGLAKLGLSEADVERFAGEMEEIVAFADQLAHLDSAEAPAGPVFGGRNALRRDERKPSYEREEMLKNCARQDGACFIVPKVVK